MSRAVEEEVNKLFEAVKDLHSLEEIRPHCEAFNEFINTKTTYSNASLGTVLSRVGFYKKFKSLPLEQGKNADLVPKRDGQGNLIGHELKHYVLLLCGLTKEDWEGRNTTTRVSDRISDGGQEVDPDTYLEVSGKLLESTNPHELAVGLIAATGRRPHEILARAKFSPIEGKEYWVSFEGQGKKRGDKPVFNIATLYPANYIIEKLNYLRKEDSTKALLKEVVIDFPKDVAAQNRSIDNRRGQSLRRVVKEYFGDKYAENPALNLRNDEDQNNCKALRAAYLCLATERDCKGSMGAKMLHAARLAGHFVKDNPTDRDLQSLVTTLGYADYFTSKTIQFPIVQMPELEKPSMVRASKEDAELIKKFQTDWNLPNQQSVVNRLLEIFQNRLEAVKQLSEANQKIAQLEAKIKELETMKAEPTAQPQEITLNVSELESLVQAKVASAVEKALQGLPVAPAATVPKQAEKPKEEINWEAMTDAEVWGSKKNGAAIEKVRRAFLAMTSYNDTVATGDNDRIAITNLALRELSGANGLVVRDWINQHRDEVISHNAKYGMENKKDPANPATYYNKGRNTEAILQLINEEFLSGEGMRKAPTEEV
jgi:hypothetical protein